MSNEARHHHYIPQGYLRGFGQKRGERQWYVHVSDLEQRRSYLTNTRNVCSERDFMRIDVAGHAPDRVEKDLSGLETKCVEAIRRVSSSGTFQGEDANLTLNLMALLAVRSPEMRENMRDFHERIAKRILDLSLATRDRWDRQLEQLRAAGRRVNDDLTYDEVKAFHEGDQYKISVKREFQIGTEFQLLRTVLEELGKRLWTVYIADGMQGEFVTTNRPVTLTYIDPSAVPSWMGRSPGFSLGGTEVHFPLTRHAMLVGRWDRGGRCDRGGHVEAAQDTFVAAANALMVENSFGQVFSREKRILYLDPMLNLRWDELLVKRFTTEPPPEELAALRDRLEEYERRNRPSS